MESHERGDATEAEVIAELKRRRLSVSIPFGDNERYDIVVATPDDRLLRVQIKTGWIRDGKIEFHGKSQHTNSTGNTYTDYEGDVDYFIVYVPDLDSMYLIGEAEFGTGMQLRIDDPEQSHGTINWAEEYRFEERCRLRESGDHLGVSLPRGHIGFGRSTRCRNGMGRRRSDSVPPQFEHGQGQHRLVFRIL